MTQRTDYYVYLHKLPDGSVFYVGMGRKQRAYGKTSRNPFWKAVVTKYFGQGLRPIVEFVRKNLTKEEALILEIQLIEQYGRRDLDTGVLVNLSTGGDHAIPGAVTRSRQSESARRKFANPDARQRVSEAQRARFANPEQRRKASAANKNNPKVLQAAVKGAETVRGKPAWNRGLETPVETKTRQSASRKAYWESLTDEERAAKKAQLAEARAVSKANKPRVHTPEEQALRKEAKRAYMRARKAQMQSRRQEESRPSH